MKSNPIMQDLLQTYMILHLFGQTKKETERSLSCEPFYL